MGVFVTTTVAIFVVSEIISWLVLILIPGRKGYLKSSRTVSLPQTNPQQASEVILRRLSEEHFSNAMQLPGTPVHIVATRPSTQRDANGRMTFAHAGKPIDADVQILPRGSSVELTIQLKMTDFVLLDSGEGEHLEQVMHRLIEGTDRPPVVIANPSLPAMNAVCWAMTTLAASSLGTVLPVVQRDHVEFAIAIAMSAASALVMASWGLLTILRRPKEISGTWLVALALLAGAAAVAAAAAIFFQLGPFAPPPGLT